MTQEDQLNKILELETQIREKQTSKFSAHTLMPVGLVLTIVGFSFAIGMNFQAANQTRTDLEQFKKEYKEAQVELKADIKSLQAYISDIRVLLVQYQSSSGENK